MEMHAQYERELQWTHSALSPDTGVSSWNGKQHLRIVTPPLKFAVVSVVSPDSLISTLNSSANK